MANNRISKINDEIKKEVAQIIHYDIKDPRLNGVIISVTKVDTTNDLKYCKVYVSYLGGEIKEVLSVLNKSSSYIRREIANRINLRATPEIKFIFDDSLLQADKINTILNEVKSKENWDE